MRIMTTSPDETKPGRIILEKYAKIASLQNVDVLLLPSSFLPYYKNTNHFYVNSRILNLPTSIKDCPNLLVITGVNEESGYENTAHFKTVVAFNSSKIINIHRKVDLEQHYIEKGFFCGSGDDFSFTYNDCIFRTLECYESLFDKNYGPCDISFVSIGFGMQAKTDNYNCDYFDEWLTILRTMAIRHQCWIVTSCNAVHKDIMTVIISRNGEVVGMAKNKGILIQDIDLNEFKQWKQPYEQNISDT